MIARKHVGIAMPAWRVCRIVGWVVPRTAGELHYSLAHCIGEDDTSETSTALVVDAYHIARRDSASPGIGRIDQDRLAARHFAASADGTWVHLAVQAQPRLV